MHQQRRSLVTVAVVQAAAALFLAAFAGAKQCLPFLDAARTIGLTDFADFVHSLKDIPSDPVIDHLRAHATQDVPVNEAGPHLMGTTFAPTNEAFKLVAGKLSDMSAPEHRAIFINHILSEDAAGLTMPYESLAASLLQVTPNPLELPTLLGMGATLDFITDLTSIYLTPSGSEEAAKLIHVDIKTCVGLLHVVDRVLVPAVVMPAVE